MSQVLQALEGPIAPMICASEDPLHAGACERTGFCNVNLLWVRVRDAVVGALDSLTLADLARPRAMHPYHSLPLHPSTAAAADLPRTSEPVTSA
jgi:DNA-binding IscR family transcriptional regulator